MKIISWPVSLLGLSFISLSLTSSQEISTLSLVGVILVMKVF